MIHVLCDDVTCALRLALYMSGSASFVFRGGSVASYGAIGTLGVVWLFDVQLSDSLTMYLLFSGVEV